MSVIGFGIFGTGQMAQIYATLLNQRPDCRLIAVAGNTQEKTEAFARQHGARAFAAGRYDEMLQACDEISAVIIATPEWVREEPLISAVRHRRHILLEKPFATSVEQARSFEALLSGYPKVFDICHVLRYSPRFLAMQRAIVDGSIGEVRHIYARRNSNRSRVLRVLGKTDLAFWLTPHDVDIMRWITASEVDEVYARCRNGLESADDYLLVDLRFSNGVDAVLEISWCTPPLSAVSREAIFEVRGTKGFIEIEDSGMNVRVFTAASVVTAPDTYEDYDIHGLRYGIFKNLIDAYVGRIKRGDKSPYALRDGVASIEVCGMISRSIREQRRITRE